MKRFRLQSNSWWTTTLVLSLSIIYGQSLASLEELRHHHDYALIDLEYNNAFLAPRELRGVRHVDAMTAYRTGYLKRPDRSKSFH